MKHNFKRFLSLVVAMVMVFGMLPMNVFATEGEPAAAVAKVNGVQYATLKEAVEAANKLGTATVIMLDNVTLGENLTISGNVTIEGEYTITRAYDYTGTLFTVNKGAELTLDGGLVIDGGNEWSVDMGAYNKALAETTKGTFANYVTPEEGGVAATAPMFSVSGTVNANDVTIQNVYKNSGTGVFDIKANAVLNMKSATIRHIAANGSNAVAYLTNGSVWTINEGTLIDGNFGGGNGGLCRNDSGLIVMNGGTIQNSMDANGNGSVFMMYGGTFEMNGGTICSNTATNGVQNGRNSAVYLHSNGKMTMTGGSICHNTGTSFGGIDTYKGSAALTITGGMVYDNVSIDGWTRHDVNMIGNTAISGGWYSQDVTEYCAEGYSAIKVFNEEVGKELYLVARVVNVTFDSFTINEGDELPEFTYTTDFNEVAEDGTMLVVEEPAVEVAGSGEYDITANAYVFENDDYYVNVIPGKLTVKDTGILTVDGVWFDSFDEAKSAIKKDSAIVLYGDVKSNYGVGCDKDYHFPGNGNITLELNGHEFRSVKSSVKGTTTTITIGANTTLTVTDSVGTGSIVIETKGHPLCLSNNSTLILPETINFEGTIQLYYVNGQVYLGKELMLGEDAPIQTNEWIDAKGVLRKYNNVYFDANGDIILGGGSFTLNEDFTWAADRNITIPASVTVDLNGNDLTAKNITVQGKLIDTADGVGVVTTDKLWFNGHNNGGYLPLADGKVYRLFATELDNRGVRAVNANTAKAGFTVRFNKVEAYDLLIDAVMDGTIVGYASFEESNTQVENDFAATNIVSHLTKARNQLSSGAAVTNALTRTIDLTTNSVDVFAELFSGETNVVIASETVHYTK